VLTPKVTVRLYGARFTERWGSSNCLNIRVAQCVPILAGLLLKKEQSTVAHCANLPTDTASQKAQFTAIMIIVTSDFPR